MRVRLPYVIAVTAVLGCGHREPFAPGVYAPTQPFNAPPPTRLTLNPGEDVMPLWLPSGDIMFTAERGDRPDRDHCLAVMPGSGGAITGYSCRTPGSNDSIDVLDEAAATASGGGRLAYVRQGSYRLPIPTVSPGVQAIVTAPLANPTASHVVRDLPYFAPSSRTHWGISHLRWLDSTRLVYVGQDVSYPRPCPQCSVDTVRVGLEIATLDLAPATPVVAIVPGTDNASSVAVGASGDTIYFTRESDAVVYRHAFSSAVTDTVHDFSLDGGTVASSVAWAPDKLFVTVDGSIWLIYPLIYGNILPATPTVSYGRLAPSGDGSRFVVETRALSASLDLWLHALR